MLVTCSRVDPARTDEASKLVQDIAAAIRRQPGCQSFVIGGDRATGRAIAVSTWDTEEHAQWIPDDLGDIGSRLQTVGIQVAHASLRGDDPGLTASADGAEPMLWAGCHGQVRSGATPRDAEGRLP
jgi:hypothetical protein